MSEGQRRAVPASAVEAAAAEPAPDASDAPSGPPPERPLRRPWALALLAIPVVFLVWPGLYARDEPRLLGVTFFIWYQVTWVLVGALIVGLVYRQQRPEDDGTAGDA